MEKDGSIMLADWRHAHIRMSQDRRPTGDFGLSADLIILVSSWEKRCLEIVEASHKSYEWAMVTKFAEQGDSGRRRNHDARLSEFAVGHAAHRFDVPIVSTGAVEIWRDIFIANILSVRKRAGRPIDIVIDVSCLPKYYVLTILGFCFSTGIVRSLRFFYAEGRYAPSGLNKDLSSDHAFTDGEWKSLPVPFLEGKLAPDKTLNIIASIGFETFQARKLIHVYEADRHFLLAPIPGLTEDYSARSESELNALATYLELSEDGILKCPAGNATCASTAVTRLVSRRRNEKWLGLCFGSKPHAIGMGVAALLLPELTLVCRLPDRYVETETPPTGTSCVFDVLDLSQPA